MTLPVPAPDPLPSPAIDTHCHLDIITDYSGLTASEAIAAAAAVGVTGVIQVAVDIGSAHRSVELAHEFPNVRAAVAIHPNEAPIRAHSGHLAADLRTLAELATDPMVCAVGETGLDYYRTDESGRTAQEQSFRDHIRLARDVGKTLVIHDREAHEAVLRVLSEERLPEQVVFHCFSGDAEMARHCSDSGWFLSIAGVVTFKNAKQLQEALRVTPVDRLLFETDAPFLTPMPHRGKPNASYLMPNTVRAIAELKDLPVEDLCRQVHANSVAAFGLEADFGLPK